MAAPTKARKATKRAAPRKATQARAKANGNGRAPAQGFNTPPLTAERAPAPAPPEITHPYGDTPVFVFRPSDGSPPIVFPRVGTLEVSAKFMWKIYDLNELFQSFEWMNLAGVPRDIQERVLDLPTTERSRFWGSWFNDVTTPLDMKGDTLAPPGESSS